MKSVMIWGATIAMGVAVWALVLPAPASAQYGLPAPAADGRMLGHLPYGQVDVRDLVAAPPGFAIGLPCLVHRDAAPDLSRLLAAAAATPGIGARLRGVSCFRTIVRQGAVFCARTSAKGACRNAVERAHFVGPPGYSEHATGYAIDFGIRPSPGCADVDRCIAATTAGRWLIAHAPDYGFELSFPSGNAQGVTWEPWHWRWVGTTALAPGAARARMTFLRARATFPAQPIAGLTGHDVVLAPVPVTTPVPIVPPQPLPRQL